MTQATAAARTFRVDLASVQVFDRKKEMGAAAAALAAGILREAVKQRGNARILVGTGPSQDEVIDSLVTQEVPWKSVELFHLDEYVGMSDQHPASFRRWLRTRVAEKVSPKAAHYLPADVPDLDAAMERYAALMKSGPMDIAFIGFGENGHIAFNDPHVADFNDPKLVKRVQLDEKCRMQQVGEGHFKDLASSPSEALTVTCPALMRAEHAICCVPDRRKAEAVRGALEGPISMQCPASIVRTHPRAHIFLDRESASLLTRVG